MGKEQGPVPHQSPGPGIRGRCSPEEDCGGNTAAVKALRGGDPTSVPAEAAAPSRWERDRAQHIKQPQQQPALAPVTSV